MIEVIIAILLGAVILGISWLIFLSIINLQLKYFDIREHQAVMNILLGVIFLVGSWAVGMAIMGGFK